VLTMARSNASREIVFHGVRQSVRESDITGGDVIEYSDEPIDVPTRLYDQMRVDETMRPPLAYVIPPEWTQIIDLLELHQVEYYRIRRPTEVSGTSFRFENEKFASRPYEGHFSVEADTITEDVTRTLPAGSVVVPLEQRGAKVAIHMLEPAAPDSCMKWGMFSPVFERKEYGEAYVMEPMAAKMLASDAALRAEFEKRLAEDERFRDTPRARLDFFYVRSPYADEKWKRYPVVRIEDEGVLSRLRSARR
jgi:hypothetical protein